MAEPVGARPPGGVVPPPVSAPVNTTGAAATDKIKPVADKAPAISNDNELLNPFAEDKMEPPAAAAGATPTTEKALQVPSEPPTVTPQPWHTPKVAVFVEILQEERQALFKSYGQLFKDEDHGQIDATANLIISYDKMLKTFNAPTLPSSNLKFPLDCDIPARSWVDAFGISTVIPAGKKIVNNDLEFHMVQVRSYLDDQKERLLHLEQYEIMGRIGVKEMQARSAATTATSANATTPTVPPVAPATAAAKPAPSLPEVKTNFGVMTQTPSTPATKAPATPAKPR